MTTENHKLDLKQIREYTLSGTDGETATGVIVKSLLDDIFALQKPFIQRISIIAGGPFVLTRYRRRDEGENDPVLGLFLRYGFHPLVTDMPNPEYKLVISAGRGE